MSADYQKKNCRYCEKPLRKSFLDLGAVPLANSYVRPEDAGKEEFKCPLSLTVCGHCRLVQLTHVVPPDLMFSNYLYVSSTTKTFREHFANYAATVKAKLCRSDKVLAVDIGSNDGLLLSCYRQEGLEIVGVDPAKNLAEDANKRGIRTFNRYFDGECVKTILNDFGQAHVISANNVFAHIDDIHSVLRNVRDLLSPEGMFVIEFPYLTVMLEEMLFDMIYHEHLSYIAVTPLVYVLKQFGFRIFDIEKVPSHGGSLRVFIQKQGGPYPTAPAVSQLIEEEKQKGYLEDAAYRAFSDRVALLKKEFMKLVKSAKAGGKTISGYGAPAKAGTIINYYGLTRDEIDYVVDDNPLKQGYWVPGAQIPIVPSDHLRAHPTDFVIIFAWNFAKEILQKIADVQTRGVRFWVPVKSVADKTSLNFEIT